MGIGLSSSNSFTQTFSHFTWNVLNNMMATVHYHSQLLEHEHTKPRHRECVRKHTPENCRAKPCLLVKKSVVNCRLTELKVLWRSGGSVEPLSSLSNTPPSWGPSQIRKTSCTSSVWKTRKCSLWECTNMIFCWERDTTVLWDRRGKIIIFTGHVHLYNLFLKRLPI